MFDLQRFDDDFGFISAEDKAKLESGGFRSVSVDGSTAYFYMTSEPTGEPAASCKLAMGLVPTIRITAPEDTEVTATLDGVTLRNKIVNAQYCDIAVTKYGTWTVSNGVETKTVTVDDVQLYSLSF